MFKIDGDRHITISFGGKNFILLTWQPILPFIVPSSVEIGSVVLDEM